jgi:SAM-dependent methyltransferase
MSSLRVPVDTDTIREDFDAIAELTQTATGVLDLHARWVRSQVPAGCRILDLGCGTGQLSRALAGAAREVVGLDVSPRMIEVATQSSAAHSNLRYVNAEFMAWQHAETFDCVVSVAALHHLPVSPALGKIVTVLRPGGRLLVVDLVSAWAPSEIPHSAFAFLAKRWRHRRSGDDVDPRLRAAWRRHGHHDRLLSLRQIRRAYRDALPGAIVTRQPSWRYRATWTKTTSPLDLALGVRSSRWVRS